jgi:hypothetical protein
MAKTYAKPRFDRRGKLGGVTAVVAVATSGQLESNQ